MTGPAICAIPIARMDAGFFWCRVATIPGVSEEEAEAFQSRTLVGERRAEIERLVTEARDALFEAEVPGAQDWMPTRRSMN
jgi:hypothetical protein